MGKNYVIAMIKKNMLKKNLN